jgi:hypothetical protein
MQACGKTYREELNAELDAPGRPHAISGELRRIGNIRTEFIESKHP